MVCNSFTADNISNEHFNRLIHVLSMQCFHGLVMVTAYNLLSLQVCYSTSSTSQAIGVHINAGPDMITNGLVDNVYF